MERYGFSLCWPIFRLWPVATIAQDQDQLDARLGEGLELVSRLWQVGKPKLGSCRPGAFYPKFLSP